MPQVQIGDTDGNLQTTCSLCFSVKSSQFRECENEEIWTNMTTPKCVNNNETETLTVQYGFFFMT